MPVLEIRTSERRTFKRCSQKWFWGYREGLKPLREANPLWFGQAIHEALAEWYKPGKKRGVHPAKTFVEVLESGKVQRFDTGNFDDMAEYAEALTMGEDMLERYVQTYGEETEWECIQPEMSFQVWFAHPVTKQPRWLRYVGTIDGVFRYIGKTNGEMRHGSIWLFEHKTAASIQIGHLPLDDQAGSYWALAGIILRKRGLLKANENIDGILYNFLRKAKDDPRPENSEGMFCNAPTKQNFLDAMTPVMSEHPALENLSAKLKVDELKALAEECGITVLGEVSKSQPPDYFERIPVFRTKSQQKKMLRRILDEGLHIESARADRPLLPIIKNPTKDCSWDCEFFRMCQLEEAGADWEAYRDVTFKTWDPYADHHGKSA